MKYFKGHKDKLTNASFWFLFFFVTYIIILAKIIHSPFQSNIFFSVYSVVITAFILSRFVLAYFHKSAEYDESYQPTVTFVVPAKNEEDNIAETIRRFARVDYPKEKIEVIAINDGSTDDTFEKMVNIKAELLEILPVKIMDWKVNRGKREAMAEGVKRANNEIIIFVDSDSFVEPACVKHLTKYFSNPRVGAVSGHTDVYNKDTNLLTAMQGVRYFISFSIYKAAESIFGAVTCCPGCCSAYRRSYLLEFIDRWLNQKFLGVKCTFGDDRSLTNFVIRKYEAVYSPMAKAHTIVPDSFKKYVKQQQRWKRSWVRESFLASAFMWKKNPVAAVSFYSYIFLSLSAPIVFAHALFWSPLMDQRWPIAYLTGLFLVLFLHGLYYKIKTGSKSWFLAIVNFWFSVLLLIWQLPWALVTIRNTRWGTR